MEASVTDWTSTASTTAAPFQCPNVSPFLLFVAAIVQSISSQREKQRSEKAKTGSSARLVYDYIVVGAGSAGCVLASRLSEKKSASVLVLERGMEQPEETRVPGYGVFTLNSEIFEIIRAVPEEQNCNKTGCVLNVPSQTGGGSSSNGMLYVRGHKFDYDEWARRSGDQGWSYDGVLPYFKKSENNQNSPMRQDTLYHGSMGPQPVSWQPYQHPVMPLLANAFEANGVPFRLDINAQGQLGHTVVQTTTLKGRRWSTWNSYIQPVLGERQNLHVETFATVKKVLLDHLPPFGQLAATGVEFQDATGKTHVAHARCEVILSAGAIHTPQILMLSGIGPREQLEPLNIHVHKDLPVGKQLLDHVDVMSVPFKCGPPLCVTDWQSRQEDLRQYQTSQTGPLSALNVLHFNVFARSSLAEASTGDAPDFQIMFLGRTLDSETCLPLDSWRLNRVLPVISLMRPYSKGWLRLNQTNPRGPPVVKLNFFSDPGNHDMSVTVEALRMAMKLRGPLAQQGLTLDLSGFEACLTYGSPDVESDAFLECVARAATSTSWHWSGTCPMGAAADPDAVLDSHLRVRGVLNLRVGDASAFPYIPSGNTNNPTIMLAERLADIIKEDNKGCPWC